MSDSQDKPNQRCCLGLLYYSQAMESQGQRPVCLGIPHTPQEAVQLPDQKQLAEPIDYKFLCLGHSLYERASTSGRQSSSTAESGSSKGSRLPYCEGLEVIMGKTLEAPAPAPAATTAGAPGGSPHPPDELSAVLTSMFGGEDSAVVKGAARFSKIASRNWDRMKTTASQAYSMTIKPLIDKLSDQ